MMTGDYVSFSADGKKFYGRVDEMSAKKVIVFVSCGDVMTLKQDEVTPVEPVKADGTAVRDFVRRRIGLEELCGGDVCQPVSCGEKVPVLAADVLEAAEKLLADKTSIVEVREWTRRICIELDEQCVFGDPEHEKIHPDSNKPGILNDGEAARFIYRQIYSAVHGAKRTDSTLQKALPNIVKKARHICGNMGKPLAEREFDMVEKDRIIRDFDGLTNAEKERSGVEYRRLVKETVDELAEKNDIKALEMTAYGSYEGDTLFPQDWVVARDSLLKLVTLCEDSSFYANSLGYIYYYGRCNGGVPQYKSAFKYFSMAAEDGVHEAIYKLSDMYMNGYYVERNTRMAKKYIDKVYGDALKYFSDGHYECKFADAAFRMGTYYEKAANSRTALIYYQMAAFAIRKRMECCDYFGDKKVASSIKAALDGLKKRIGDKMDAYMPRTAEEAMACIASECDVFKAKVMRTDKCPVLRVRPDDKSKMPVYMPASGTCEIAEKADIRLIGNVLIYPCSTEKFKFTEVRKNDFVYKDEVIATISADSFVIGRAGGGKKHTFAAVVFNENGREYDYLCGGKDVKSGDTAVVETRYGMTEVKVVRVYTCREDEAALPMSAYKKIVEVVKKDE